MYNQYGNDGQIAIFYRDEKIANFPLGFMKLRDYQKNAEKLILDGMRDGLKVKEIIYACKLFCESIRCITWTNTRRKKYKQQPISKHDYRLFICSLFALVKLQIVQEDDAFLIFEKKSVLKKQRYYNQ